MKKTFLLVMVIFSSCGNSLINQIVEPREVTFESNGGSHIKSQTVYKGQTINKPADPSRSGYTFAAWYNDNETFLEEWDFDVTPDGDTILYAKWDEGRIYSAAITIVEPLAGAAPGKNADGEGNFTIGEVSWTPDDNPFNPVTVYTASVTLTANETFIFADNFTAAINENNAAIANNLGATVELIYQFKSTGAAVDAPTADFVGVTSVTLNAVTADTGQDVEYSVNTTNTAPNGMDADNWQSDTTFSGLTAGTDYYFFARSVFNDDYLTGAASTGAKITTKQHAKDDTIINYWVDDNNEIHIGTGGQPILDNIVTVVDGNSVTFSAAAAGYTSHRWTLNGIDTGITAAEYTFETSDRDKEPGKNYIIGLMVQKDGNYYYTRITVRII